MRAIVCPKYRPPDVLQLQEIEKSIVEPNEVLVKVHAASVNALDWRTVRASPFLVRLMGGFWKPKRPRLGVDFAGQVEALGPNATEFHSDDELFGRAYGTFADSVSASEKEIALKPADVSYEAAAAVPIAGLTALQALRDKAVLRAGPTVLVNGAGGGVGTFVVQIAKALGAEVTGTSNSGNLDLLRSIGADHVIDYSRQDFTQAGIRYDLIIDLHPTHSFRECKRALNPQGIYLALGFEGLARLISLVFRQRLTSNSKGKRAMLMMARPTKKDLGDLAELLASGKMVPVIERRYALSEVPAAIRYLETGHARGKVVINVEPDYIST